MPASARVAPPSRPDTFPASNSGSDQAPWSDAVSLSQLPLSYGTVVREDTLSESVEAYPIGVPVNEFQVNESPLQVAGNVLSDVLFGNDDPPDDRLASMTLAERADLAFEQRLVPATATNVFSLWYGPKLAGVLSRLLPDVVEVPAKIVASAGVGRFTFPPAKQLADWYHGEVLDQPIVDPAEGVFTDENAADMLYAVPSVVVGMGTQALTTTALTALGVSNPFTLTLAGLASASYTASKGWAVMEEQLVPTAFEYVRDSVVESIDVEKLTGVPEPSSGTNLNLVSIEELEALWDAVADQIPATEAEALSPAVGVVAPDSWTMADMATYEATGVMPAVSPELEEFLERNGLSPHEPEVDETREPVDTAVLTSPRPPMPMFRSTRVDTEVPVETVTIVDYLPQERTTEAASDDASLVSDRFAPHENDDGPDPQCLIPVWLIPYKDELWALGVRNFCALRHLTSEDIEELIELADVPNEPAQSDEAELGIPVVFASTRVDKTLEEDEDEEDVTSVFLLV